MVGGKNSSLSDLYEVSPPKLPIELPPRWNSGCVMEPLQTFPRSMSLPHVASLKPKYTGRSVIDVEQRNGQNPPQRRESFLYRLPSGESVDGLHHWEVGRGMILSFEGDF